MVAVILCDLFNVATILALCISFSFEPDSLIFYTDGAEIKPNSYTVGPFFKGFKTQIFDNLIAFSTIFTLAQKLFMIPELDQ